MLTDDNNKIFHSLLLDYVLILFNDDVLENFILIIKEIYVYRRTILTNVKGYYFKINGKDQTGLLVNNIV